MNAARLQRIGIVWATALAALVVVVAWFSGVFVPAAPSFVHERGVDSAAEGAQVGSVDDVVCLDASECPEGDLPFDPGDSESQSDIDDDDDPERIVAVVCAPAIPAPEVSTRISALDPALEVTLRRLPRPCERV